MRFYTNVELAKMHFMCRAAWENGTAVQRMYKKRFKGRNPWDRRIFECLHRMLCANRLFHISRHDMSTRNYRIIPAKEAAALRTEGDSPSISSRAVGHLLRGGHLLSQSHALNACRQAPHWCSHACCSKSVRRVMIQISKLLSSAEINSDLYSSNAILSHPNLYTKSAYVGPLYLLYVSDR